MGKATQGKETHLASLTHHFLHSFADRREGLRSIGLLVERPSVTAGSALPCPLAHTHVLPGGGQSKLGCSPVFCMSCELRGWGPGAGHTPLPGVPQSARCPFCPAQPLIPPAGGPRPQGSEQQLCAPCRGLTWLHPSFCLCSRWSSINLLLCSLLKTFPK